MDHCFNGPIHGIAAQHCAAVVRKPFCSALAPLDGHRVCLDADLVCGEDKGGRGTARADLCPSCARQSGSTMNSPSPAAGDSRPLLDVSVVIPLFNEEESIEPLYEGLRAALGGLKKTFEIIFIN